MGGGRKHGSTEARKYGRKDGRLEIPPCVLQDIYKPFGAAAQTARPLIFCRMASAAIIDAIHSLVFHSRDWLVHEQPHYLTGVSKAISRGSRDFLQLKVKFCVIAFYL